MNTPESSVCPKCGAPLPADAPGGLCPRCLVALNFATETGVTGEDAGPATAPLSPEEIAPHFPQLDVLECLGRGGMGVVYKARQKTLGRLVALKLLAPGKEKDPQFAERFTREAQALARLDHPHIVTVHDFGQTNGFFYLLMEFVDGVNLRQLLRTRKLTPEEALAIVPPICEALQFAHDRGIVHRDIKPENLLLGKDGQIKIADFGIARMLGTDIIQPDQEKAAGTPGYMAPEQRETPGRADSRADIYSLGVVFYEILTGELPSKRIEPPSRKVRVDVRIDEIVLRALEKEPELRFQTAAELGRNVSDVSSSTIPSSRGSRDHDHESRGSGRKPHVLDRWERAWTAMPYSRRRLIGSLLAGAAVICFMCFGWPDYQLTVVDGRANATWSFGIPEPWLEMRSFPAGGMHNPPRQSVGMLSFCIGIFGMMLWMVLARLQSAEARTALENPAFLNTTKSTALILVFAALALAHMGLLICSIIPVQPFLVMAMMVAIGFPSLARSVLRKTGTADESVDPLWSPKVGWGAAGILLAIVLAWFLFRSVNPHLRTLASPQVEVSGATPMEQGFDPVPAPAEAGVHLPETMSMIHHAAPNPGTVKPPPPPGANFVNEQQVVVPADSRVALELYQMVNDGDRARLGNKLVFKTPIDSGLGVLLRWHGYGPTHAQKPNCWVLELVDAQSGTTFHLVEGKFGAPTEMTPLDGSAKGTGALTRLETPGWAYVRLLRATKQSPPGRPITSWSELQAFVTSISPIQAGDPAIFQLPPAPQTKPPTANDSELHR